MFKKILLAFVAFVSLLAQAKFDPTAATVQVVIVYA